MNQADARVIGASAATAIVASIVTVTVYTGHVKVSGGGQPTVVIAPGETHVVRPPVQPQPQPEPPIVGVAKPIDPTTTTDDLRIPAGETATIHAVDEVLVEVVASGNNCVLALDGLVQFGMTMRVDVGVHRYAVTCDGVPPIEGRIALVHDDATRPIPKDPPVNPIAADGRNYRISYQRAIPDISVTGGTGTLHLSDGTNVRAYASPLIPGTDLREHRYTYWFDSDSTKVSTLVIDFDQSAPQVMLTPKWAADLVSVLGAAVPGWQLTVAATPVPFDAQQRFATSAPLAANGVFVARFTHPQRGIHYYVLRSPNATRRQVTVATGDTLGRNDIEQAISAAKDVFRKCADKVIDVPSPGTQQGKVVLKVTVQPDGSVGDVEVTSTYDHAAGVCVAHIMRSLSFPQAKQPTTFSYPITLVPSTKIASCDPEAPKQKGVEYAKQGQHAVALALFEDSLRCKDDHDVVILAVMNACSARNAAKARHYYGKLKPTAQAKAEAFCAHEKITLAQQTATCDPVKSRDEGMELINLGQHAEALAKFEESLACKHESYTLQLAFMEACASKDKAKAMRFYPMMTASQQVKFMQICIRNDVHFDHDETIAAGGTTGHGFLQLTTKPSGLSVLIDGKDTGLTTPVTGRQLALSPGKHKVTFSDGTDRFTYPVIIHANKIEKMSKDLQ